MEKKGLDRANVGMSQNAGPSKVNDIEYEGASTESLSDADIRAPMDFDDLHPPSPKVPKGGIIKCSKVLNASTILKINEEDSSSDIDMRLSGKVCSGLAAGHVSSANELSGV